MSKCIVSSPTFLYRALYATLTFLALANGASTGQAQVLSKIPGANPKGAFDKVLDQQVGKLLGEELPLTLNAKDAYPTVDNDQLPGGPFQGKPLQQLTPDMLTKPLPPGDYILSMTFFCSEYGEHQPNGGMAYTLGPAEGKLSTPIATLLWRGMMVGRRPQELQMISWAIQASIPYSKMPPEYQKTIDELLPDFKAQLNGQGFTQIKNGYDSVVTDNIAKYNKVGTAAKIITLGKVNVSPIQAPSLDIVLARLGTLGHLALNGERQATLISANYVNNEKREQTVFAGQGTQAPPQPAVSGPWSRKAPDVYMRFVVKGGNLSGNNEMQIRVVAAAPSMDVARYRGTNGAHLQLASYQVAMVPSAAPSLLTLFGGVSDEAILARCVISGPGYPECVALSVVVAGVVSYEINKAGQAPVPAPTLPITPPVTAMGKQSKESGKTKADDPPSWIQYYLPIPPNDSCAKFAEDALNDKYGKGTKAAMDRGPGSEYSKIKKACERGGIKR